MFTVVIAEFEHIRNIKNYEIFLKPYLNDNFSMCEWIPEGETLAEAVPKLEETVSQHKQWRAVILCNEEGIQYRNPFELVQFDCPKRPESTNEEVFVDYLKTIQTRKFAAYDEASKKPLTRLATRLCEEPIFATGGNNQESHRNEKQEEKNPRENAVDHIAKLEFDEYWSETQYKSHLRREMLFGEKTQVYYPAEIICIAKRTHQSQEHAIASAWATHDVSQYRRFYDWNMYYDKMRYIVYDIIPSSHRQYQTEYLKFLATVLLIAANEFPTGAIRPNLVYSIKGESEDNTLRQILQSYDKKLCATEEEIENRIKRLQSSAPKLMQDEQVEAVFGGEADINVAIGNQASLKEMYVNKNEYGLATDVPRSEFHTWSEAYKSSKKAVMRLLKLAPRALKRAGETLRLLVAQSVWASKGISEFQMEDIVEKIDGEEMAMVQVFAQNGFHTKKDEEDLFKSAGYVYSKIATRITYRQIIISGAVTALALLISFAPLIVEGIKNGEVIQVHTAIILFLGAAVLLAGIGLVCLFGLRAELQGEITGYNTTVREIDAGMSMSLEQYSSYFGHLCRAMRGHRALNYLAENESDEVKTIRIYRKHQSDIITQRCQLRALFGGLLPPLSDVFCQDTDPYRFDFETAMDYQYDMPLQKGSVNQIEFFGSGNTVQSMSKFIQCITVRLEEYYD